ncbi:MAG: SDR family oxidoreductase [Bacteroidota bacterium]|jgi:short-subunit dehydrogenase|nr:SDR family oxidoreductase [Bacteroidota bacterium]
MSETALITGASKGIGKEFAVLFAERKCNLVLVARSADQLEELKKALSEKHGVRVYTIVKDLSALNAVDELFQEVKTLGVDVDYVVNNAGFGDHGAFVNTQWERYENMISLNVEVLTHLSHLYACDWVGRKRGRIVNISSTAAFQPGPMMAVYFATKAYVLHLSEALNQELREEGITVTTLCPGPTRTHFLEDSGMKAARLVKNVKVATPRSVAELGFKAMMRGKPVAIHGAMNKVAPFAIRFLPRKWVTRLSAKVMGRSKEFM